MHKLVARSRRDIPSVTEVLESLGKLDLPRPLIVDLVRRELSKLRAAGKIPDPTTIVDLVRAAIDRARAGRIQPVINGTGIVIHTNFGRAPLAPAAVLGLNDIARGYSNLEFDLATGERGTRGNYIEHALALLCGAEAATVVNNCAAALVLIVHHFAGAGAGAGRHAASHAEAERRRVGAKMSDTTARVPPTEVIISRGEMIQIGGGFRIGEILETAGATLREVGATNKTTLTDYERTISSNTALILKVHRSNFVMSGFVESPSSSEIAALAHKKRVPFVEDLGSGAIVATEQFGIAEHEPTPVEALHAGADLVCFSGDKLFGGPQAGIIVGKKRFIVALKRNPLFRALRCDKLSFAALQATVDLHLNASLADVPALALLQMPKDELRARAAAIFGRLQGLPLQITIGRGKAKIGGGTLPRSVMSSVTIDICPQSLSLEVFAAALRNWTPPIIGYIAEDRFRLDLRTIFAEQDDIIVDAIRTSCSGVYDR
jgi:L-seryl-tRNA(Ser) seleniumtransferase